MQKRCGSIYVKGWVGERRRLQESKFKIIKKKTSKAKVQDRKIKSKKKKKKKKKKRRSMNQMKTMKNLFLICWILFLFLFFCFFVCFFFLYSFLCFVSFEFLLFLFLFKIVFVIVVCLSPFVRAYFFHKHFFWMIFYDYSGNVWFCEWVFVGNGSAFSNTQSHDILFFFLTLYDVRKKNLVHGLLCFWRLWEYPCASRNFGIVLLCYA